MTQTSNLARVLAWIDARPDGEPFTSRDCQEGTFLAPPRVQECLRRLKRDGLIEAVGKTTPRLGVAARGAWVWRRVKGKASARAAAE